MESNIQFLEKIYQSAASTAYSLQKVAEKSEDKDLYDLIEKQRLATEAVSHSIERKLIDCGKMPSQPSVLAKCDIVYTLMTGTIADSSPSKLAEITINKLQKEIDNLDKSTDEFACSSPDINTLLNELLTLDRNSIEALKLHI